MINKEGTAIFIVPRASTSWKGNEAGWITASGWAQAGKEVFGNSVVATTDGVFDYLEARNFPVIKKVDGKGNSRGSFLRNFVPEVFITLIKDIKLYLSKPKELPIYEKVSSFPKPLNLVWQRHDLFSPYGSDIAKKFNVPLIISVEAAVVWEAKKWGVKRPLWGKLMEYYDETKNLKKADLVICVSEELKGKLIHMGVAKNRILVTPNRVDNNQFNTSISGTDIRKKFNLQDNFIIGWTGSFRNFHGLDDVINAFSKVHENNPNTRLMLVGDGQLSESLKQLAQKLLLKDKIVFTGKVPFTEVNKYVAAFDIALVSASTSSGFHYSPLKLREYMACGKPVIAPEAGDLQKQFINDEEILFYKSGDVKHLSDRILSLVQNIDLREKLGQNSIKITEREGNWRHELNRVIAYLENF